MKRFQYCAVFTMEVSAPDDITEETLPAWLAEHPTAKTVGSTVIEEEVTAVTDITERVN